MKRALFLISLLSVVFSSCKQEINTEIPTIDLSNADQLFGVCSAQNVAKNIRYIPLKTDDETIVGRVFNVYYHNGMIFFYDNENTIFVFSDKGDIISKFNRSGRGPEEYSSINRLSIDPYSNHLLVGDRQSYLEYDFHGNFIRSIPLPQSIEGYISSISDLQPVKDGKYVGTLVSRSTIGALSGYVSDASGNILRTIETPVQKTEEPEVIKNAPRESSESDDNTYMQMAIVMFSPNIYAYEDRIVIYCDKFNHIISTDGNTVDTLFQMTFGKFARKDSNGTSKDFLSLNRIMESKKHLLLRFSAGGGLKKGSSALTRAIYNKSTGEIVILDASKDGAGNLIDSENPGLNFWPSYISRDGKTAVGKIEAINFKEMADNPSNSEKIRKMGAEIDEDDNFVVVIMDMK